MILFAILLMIGLIIQYLWWWSIWRFWLLIVVLCSQMTTCIYVRLCQTWNVICRVRLCLNTRWRLISKQFIITDIFIFLFIRIYNFLCFWFVLYIICKAVHTLFTIAVFLLFVFLLFKLVLLVNLFSKGILGRFGLRILVHFVFVFLIDSCL